MELEDLVFVSQSDSDSSSGCSIKSSKSASNLKSLYEEKVPKKISHETFNMNPFFKIKSELPNYYYERFVEKKEKEIDNTSFSSLGSDYSGVSLESDSDSDVDSNNSGHSCQENEERDYEAENSWINEPLKTTNEAWITPFVKNDKKIDFGNNLNIFELIFTEELFSFIAEETNQYARKKINEENAKLLKKLDIIPEKNKKNIEEKIWKDTSSNEIRSFVGLSFMMGIIRKPSLIDYWTSDCKMHTEIFEMVMTHKRFQDLLKYLHIECTKPPKAQQENPYIEEEDNKLKKIEYVLNYLKEKWNYYKSPNQNLTIDESDICFRGKPMGKQYLPTTKRKMGLKMWLLVDSVSAYVHNLQVYTGKKLKNEIDYGKNVVLKLAKSLNPGHVLFFDNFFTSISLFEELTKRGIGAIGLLKKDSKGVPKAFYSQKLDQYCSKCICHKVYKNIKVIIWKEFKPAYYLTNCVGYKYADSQKIDRHTNKKISMKKPEAIVLFNQFIHGVEIMDQLSSYYSVSRKKYKWWKQVLFFLLEITMSNSYTILREVKGAKIMTRKEYRLFIIEQLLMRNPLFVNFKLKRIKLTPHLPVEKEKARSCRWCKQVKGRKIKVVWYCDECKIPLCPECFKPFHINFKV